MSKLFLIAAVCFLFVGSAYAQGQTDAKKAETPADSVEAPYLKYPTLPAFNILMMDSTTIFNTYNIPEGGPVAIVFFSPDCGHCKRTTRRLTDSMAMFKDVRFYFITPVHTMQDIRSFYDEFHMKDHDNIKLVGRDYEFFFGSFYDIKYVPDVVIYDGQKKLIKLIQGETTAKKLYELLHPAGG